MGTSGDILSSQGRADGVMELENGWEHPVYISVDEQTLEPGETVSPRTETQP